MSVTYLPVYALSEDTSPVSTDYFVVQGDVSTGDVGLLSIANFITVFADDFIDDETVTDFTNIGWTSPS